MANIQVLLPADHIAHIRASNWSKKNRLVCHAASEHFLFVEYLPGTSAVNVVLTGQPDRSVSGQLDGLHPVGLMETLDRLTAGIVLFNENLNIFYTNKSAQRIFASGAGLNNQHGYLTCRDPEITAELKRMAVDQKDHLLSIDRGEGRTALNLLVTALKSNRGDPDRHSPSSILFAFETTHDYARIEEVVRSLYRLSPSEARLVSQLFITPNLPNAAAVLGITLNTARTHLKRIYGKTRVNRIASLIHMIVTGPASIILNTEN
jgi:hypothetical protein